MKVSKITGADGTVYELPKSNIDTATIQSMIDTAIRAVRYAVGDIFITTREGNPADILGYGTWTAFGAGRTLVGVDTEQTEFNTVQKTGGSKYIQNHTHPFEVYINNGNSMPGGIDRVLVYGMPAGSPYYTHGHHPNVTTGTSGNLQPYITVYMWLRTA